MTFGLRSYNSVLRKKTGDLIPRFFLYILTPVICFILSETYAFSGDHTLFIPIKQNGFAKVTDWTTQGLSKKLAQKLVAYQHDPNKITAAKVLKDYKQFKNLDENTRGRIFAKHEKLFQTIVGLKIEMIQRGISGIQGVDHSIQFGSSAKRLQEWANWKHNLNSDPDKMPALLLDKTLSSDVDIMNRATSAALDASAMADERVNGAAAEMQFNAKIKQLYNFDLTAQDIMVEFLSPTRAIPIIQKKYGFGPNNMTWPKNMPAYILSNKEKYNAQFGEEQLDQWLKNKGVVTPDVNDPFRAVNFQEFSDNTPAGKNPLKGFFHPDSLAAWMANNQRQIFQTHKGSEHALAKYVPRMIEGYEKAGIKPPEVNGLSGEQVKKIALQVYSAKTPDEYDAIKKKYPDLAGMLSSYCSKLLVDSHDQLTDKIIETYQKLGPKNRNEQSFGGFRKAVESSAEIEKLQNHLAWTYVNIDAETQGELRKRAKEKIKAAMLSVDNKSDSSGKTNIVDGKIRFRGLIARQLNKMLDQVTTAADTTRSDSKIYSDIRDGIGGTMNGILHKNWGVTMDDLLIQMANDTRSVEEIRWISGQGITKAKRSQNAKEIAEDLATLQSMASFFNWSKKSKKKNHAAFLHDYMQGNPDAAIGILRHLHTIFDPGKIPPKTFSYEDNNGKTVTKTIEPNQFTERGRSLGILLFASTMKSYSIWGDIQDGKACFNQLYNIYGTSQTSAQRAKSHADLLGRALALSDHLKTVKYFSDIQYNVNWLGMGNSLSTMCSLSAADEFGPEQERQLLNAVIKDISLMIIPQLGVVYTLYGIGAWGWDSIMLAGSKADVIDLLVENGKWDFSKITRKQPASNKKKQKVETKCFQQQITADKADKFPELLGVNYYDSNNHAESMPVNQVTKLLTDKYAKSGVNIIKEENGEKKVVKTVFPRKSILDISKRKGFLSNDLMLRYSRESAQSFNTLWTRTFSHNNLTNSEFWTKKNIETSLKVEYPKGVTEDSLCISGYIGKNKSKIITKGDLSVEGALGWSGLPTGKKVKIKNGTRVTFAYFVADYWAKRQALLEGPVLDELIKEASKRKYKQDNTSLDQTLWLSSLLDFLERAKRIDERVWEKIAGSALPFRPDKSSTVSAQQTTALPSKKSDKKSKKDQVAQLITKLKIWDPGKKYPIAKQYYKVTNMQRKSLIEYSQWLIDPGAYPVPSRFVPTGRGFSVQKVELTAAEVIAEVKLILGSMVDTLYKVETVYDDILTRIKKADDFVKQGNGFSLNSIAHLRIDPGKQPAGYLGFNGDNDTNFSKIWLKEYKGEEVKTEKDIATFLSWNSEDAVKAQLARWGVMYAYSQEHDSAHLHPYWHRLLRLRFQIRKLTNMLASKAYLTKNEMLKYVDNKMLLDNAPLKVPDELNYPNSASFHAHSVSEWIKIQIDAMNKEYYALILGAQDVLKVKLELSRGPTSGAFQVISELRAKAILSLNEKKKTTGSNKKTSVTSPSNSSQATELEKIIAKDVKKINWGIYTDKTCTKIWKKAQVTNTKIDPKKMPEWICPLFESGKFFLRFRAYGKNDLILGEKIESFTVKPASLKGKLKIWGDFPEKMGQGNIILAINPCKKGSLAPVSNSAASKINAAGTTTGSTTASPSSDNQKCNTWALIEHKIPEKLKDARPFSGRDIEVDLFSDIDRINVPGSIMKTLLDSQDCSSIYGDLQIWAHHGKMAPPHYLKHEKISKPGVGNVDTGIMLITDPPRFEIFVPYKIPVKVVVSDASCTLVNGCFPKEKYRLSNADIHLVLNGSVVKKSKPGAPASILETIVPFSSERKIKQTLLAKVFRNHASPKVQAVSSAVTFDADKIPNEIRLPVMLPLFEKGNLSIKGHFISAANISPAAVLSSGSMRTNISEAVSIGADGNFSTTNSLIALLSKKLMVYGLLFDNDDKMYKPKGGVFSAKLKKGAVFDTGDIEVVPYEVTVEPVKVRVVDKTGKMIPHDRLNVTMGDEIASWNKDKKHFAAPWTISKKNEELDIKAVLTMPDGSLVTGNTIVTMDPSKLLTNFPKPPPEQTIKLNVHSSLQISGSTAIQLPSGKKKPLKVQLKLKDIQEIQHTDIETVFSVPFNGPFEIGKMLEVTAKAKHSGDKILYKVIVAKSVPENPNIDFGTIILSSSQIDNFLTIGSGRVPMQVTSPDGKGKPVMGEPMSATAKITIGQYEGPLPIIEWKRFSDNHIEKQFKNHVTKRQVFNLSVAMPAVPKNMRTKDDVLELYISDGIDHEVRKTVAFTWETGDEFLKPFQYTSIKKGKRGTKFVIGEKISIQGTWKIAKDNGKKRTLVYYAGGSEFFREDIIVPKGQRFTHSAILDTLGLKKGLLEIKADMINSEHKLIATGIGKIHMVEPKDVILAAGAGASSGTVGNRGKFTQGNKVYVTGVVQAAEGKDGLRTLQLKYRGQVVLTEQMDMKGDEKLSRSFEINSDKLSAKNHVFALELYDDEFKRQDREIVRIRLAKKQKNQNSGTGQGGLQNVTCTGDTVSIKVWDHSSQDGDIVTLTLAGKPVLSYFNMGHVDKKKKINIPGCGGAEPFKRPCAFMNLPFPAGTKVAVSVTAHNTGTAGPNTAALKVDGDCTPEVQYWNLKTGETSSIFISRVEAPQQQGGNNGSTGKPGNSKPENQASGSQPSVQSWP